MIPCFRAGYDGTSSNSNMQRGLRKTLDGTSNVSQRLGKRTRERRNGGRDNKSDYET